MKHDKTARKGPSHNVYIVEGEGDDAFWTKIGSAWSHDDGDGFNVQLSALPIAGRLVIRKRQPKQQGGRD
ncbi:hypothetical protein [Methyloraptor flagellatus]|uniref:Uncharacterized protein n=1 Tax=Methyloraptor flagellatus TaxID=3162530 RepID=A0AAU7XHG0_9HYPH